MKNCHRLSQPAHSFKNASAQLKIKWMKCKKHWSREQYACWMHPKPFLLYNVNQIKTSCEKNTIAANFIYLIFSKRESFIRTLHFGLFLLFSSCSNFLAAIPYSFFFIINEMFSILSIVNEWMKCMSSSFRKWPLSHMGKSVNGSN